MDADGVIEDSSMDSHFLERLTDAAVCVFWVYIELILQVLKGPST